MIQHTAATDALEVEGDALGPLLVEQEVLGETELERAEARAGERGLPLEKILREEHRIPRELLERAITEHYRVPTAIQTSITDTALWQKKTWQSRVLGLLFGEDIVHRSITRWQEWRARQRRQTLERRAFLEARREEQHRLSKKQEERRYAATRGAQQLRAGNTSLTGEGIWSWLTSGMWYAAWREGWTRERARARAERIARAKMWAEMRERIAAKPLAWREGWVRAQAARAAKREEQQRAKEAAREEAARQAAAAAAEKRRIAEERSRERARQQEEKRQARAARMRAWRAGMLQPFFHPIAQTSVQMRSAVSAEDDAKRLGEEARREAMRQMLIEQEKEKLRQASEESLLHQRKAGEYGKGQQHTEDPAAIEAARQALEHERLALAEERAALESAKMKPSASDRAGLEAEKERIRLQARADAQAAVAAERAALEAEKARLKMQSGSTTQPAPESTLLAAERERTQRDAAEAKAQIAAERAALAVEKEHLRAEALAQAHAEIQAEQVKASFAKTREGSESKRTMALEQELAQWKKQAEQIEQQRLEIEKERVRQQEADRLRIEQQRIEEEKIHLERERIERERQALALSKAHKERLSTEKEVLEEEKREWEKEKKREQEEEVRRAIEAKTPAPASRSAPPKKPAVSGKKEEKKVEIAPPEQAEIDIGKILLAQNYIDEAELRDASARAKERNIPLEHILKDEGLVTKEIMQNAIAEYFKVPFLDLRAQPPDSSVIELLPESFSTAYSAVAVEKREDGSLLVATSSPEQPNLLEQIKKIVPAVPRIDLAYASKESVESALTFYRKPLDTRFRRIMEEHKKIAPEIIEEIFSDAIQLGASDIHFEPQEKIVIVRFRVDGVMHEAGRIPKEYYEGIVNRIKIASNMRIDEHFTAQDGAIRWKSGTKAMDVRVSIVPIVDGEKVVMRLLSEYVRTLTLSDLGFTREQREILIRTSHKPFGMVLTTGPTGSGKSTTLYGLMKIRNTPDVNISTIEDPVEYKIAGINHIQVNTKTDLTFERGLRALVRQDPDIILVGEIRDNITAEISVNAALTGHLLFSTLHANDAATAVPRLLEMGIEPYLLASTLEIIIAQRLMRRICMNCRFSQRLAHDEACRLFPHAERYFLDGEVPLYRGKGCSACGGTGFRGRIGIYELLVMTQEIEDIIVKRGTTAEINNIARAQGMLTLFEDGLQKVKNGLSTIDELLRVAAPPDILPPSPHVAAIPQA